MNSKMLGSGDRLEIFRIGTLQAADKCRSYLAGKEGIFSVGLLSATPSWITIDIDIGRPERQAVVDGVIVFALRLVILGSRFRGDRVGNPLNEFRVPRGRDWRTTECGDRSSSRA